jgi:hypothetical protein
VSPGFPSTVELGIVNEKDTDGMIAKNAATKSTKGRIDTNAPSLLKDTFDLLACIQTCPQAWITLLKISRILCLHAIAPSTSLRRTFLEQRSVFSAVSFKRKAGRRPKNCEKM